MLGEPVRFRPVNVTVDGFDQGENLIGNGGFDSSLSPWSPSNPASSPGTSRWENGHLLMRANAAPPNGTVSISQFVRKPDQGTLWFRYTAWTASNGPVTFAARLRERDANNGIVDQVLRKTVGGTQVFEWAYTPTVATSNTVQVIFELRAQPGTALAVAIDDVSLRTGPDLTWTSSGHVLSTAGRSAQVLFDRLGENSIAVHASRLGASSWSATTTTIVPIVAPVARLSTTPDPPVAASSYVLDASVSSDADSPLVLADPTFANLGTAWKTFNSANGAFTTTTIPGGGQPAVQLRVADPTRSGALLLAQTVPRNGARAAVFSVDVQGVGLQGYFVQFVERNATGILANATVRFPASGQEQRIAAPWKVINDNATALTINLRGGVKSGVPASMTVKGPRIESGLTYQFSLDGQAFAPTSLPTWPLPFADDRPHHAHVLVTDDSGANSTADLNFSAVDEGYAWSIVGPAVAPLRFPITLDASGTRRLGDLSNFLSNPTFAAGTAGWAVASSRYAQVNLTALEDSGGPYGRLAATSGNHADQASIVQPVADPRCLTVPCRLSFEARVARGAPTLDPAIHATKGSGAGATSVDAAFTGVVTTDWATFESTWTPIQPQLRNLQVILRFLLGANEQAAVDFRNVRFAPLENFTWSVSDGGVAQTFTGQSIQMQFDHAGTYSVSTKIVNAFNFAYAHDFTVQVLPVSFFPTLDGAVGIHVDDTTDGQESRVALLDGQANVTWEAVDGREEGNATVPSFTTGSDAFFLPPSRSGQMFRLSANGVQTTYAVDDVAAQLPAPLGTPQELVSHSGFGTRLRVGLPVPDEAVSGTATLSANGAVLARVPLRSGGGWLYQSVDLPRTIVDQDVTVHYDLTEGWGASASADSIVHVRANPSYVAGLGGVVLLLVAGAIAGVVWFVRRPRGP